MKITWVQMRDVIHGISHTLKGNNRVAFAKPDYVFTKTDDGVVITYKQVSALVPWSNIISVGVAEYEQAQPTAVKATPTRSTKASGVPAS